MRAKFFSKQPVMYGKKFLSQKIVLFLDNVLLTKKEIKGLRTTLSFVWEETVFFS